MLQGLPRDDRAERSAHEKAFRGFPSSSGAEHRAGSRERHVLEPERPRLEEGRRGQLLLVSGDDELVPPCRADGVLGEDLRRLVSALDQVDDRGTEEILRSYTQLLRLEREMLGLGISEAHGQALAGRSAESIDAREKGARRPWVGMRIDMIIRRGPA